MSTPSTNSRLTILSDNSYEAYLNGALIGRNQNSWGEGVDAFDLHLEKGNYVLAIKADDYGDPASLIAAINKDGSRSLVSSTAWRVSKKQSKGWNQLGFNDANWFYATDHGISPWGHPSDINKDFPAATKWIWDRDISVDTVYMRAAFTVTENNQINSTPIVKVKPRSFTPGDKVNVKDNFNRLFNIQDPDGDAIATYEFFDSNLSENSGAFYRVSTNKRYTKNHFTISANDLGDLEWRAGITSEIDGISLKATDTYGATNERQPENTIWTSSWVPSSEPVAYGSIIGSNLGSNQIHESSRDPFRFTFYDPTSKLKTVYWKTESLSKITIDGQQVDAVTTNDFRPRTQFGRPSTITTGGIPNPAVPLRGSASLTGRFASFDLHVLADQRTEGDEQFKVVFYKDSKLTQELHRSKTITIKDSSRDPLFYRSSVEGNGFIADPILVEGRDTDDNLQTTDELRISFRTNDETLSTVYWQTQAPQKVVVGNNTFDSVNKYDFLSPDGRPLSGLSPLSGSQQIKNGEAQISIKATADHILEDTERFRLIFYRDAELNNQLHQTNLFTIRDTSNKPLISIERLGRSTLREGEDALYRFQRFGSTANPLEVKIRFRGEARADRDYLRALDSVVFREGEDTTELRLQTYDDALDEGSSPERLTVSLVPGSNYEIDSRKASASVDITDSTILTSNLPQTTEGGKLRFTLTRTNPTGQYSNPLFIAAVLEDGLGRGAALEGATAHLDYRRDGALCFVFPAGERQVSIDVQTIDDQLAESTYEDLRLHVLAPVSGLTAYTFTGIIIDNDRDSITGNPLQGARELAKQIRSTPSYGDPTRIGGTLASQQLRVGLRNSPEFVSSLQTAMINNGRLVGNDSASLVGNDSASIIPGGTASLSNITSITSQDIVSLIANGGGNLVANGGGN